MEDKLKKIDEVINDLDSKDFGLYFFVLDTKGNPTAGVANIYEHVKILRDLGYNANILHEDDDYHGVQEWLGAEYMEIPHISIKSQELMISNKDFLIVPEIFSNLMEKVKGLPCSKIVLSQNYHYILDILNPGVSWLDYGFKDVITTSNKQGEYIKNLFPSINTHIVPVSIPEYFKPTKKMKQPVVSIVSRNQEEAVKLAKSFYLQYPTYKFVTFRELRGLPRKSFAEELGKSCLAIWIDETAGFGTFPIEAMESETPVIGKIPNLIPEWMEDKSEGDEITLKNNGVWTDNVLNMPELIATYMKVWFEDSVPEDLLKSMESSKGKYTLEKQVDKIKEVYEKLISDKKNLYESQKDNLENE